jgi:hypothetical protein
MRDLGCDNDGVSPTPAQQPRVEAIAAEITARLADLVFALPGTVAGRLTRCGYPGYRCRADPRSRTARTTSGPARKTGRPPPRS